jgi:stage II sporulation protein R
MKKKHLAIIYLLILTIGTIASLYIPKQEAVKADTGAVVIPDEAIRLRILANSDKEADQAVKRLIRDEVNKDITGWVAELTSLSEARDVITSHLDDIQATAESVMVKEGLNQSVKVNFGQAKFPTKLYGQYLYPAGDYEAVIITLGEGDGANWWCVLFPPLCFLDFSNGTAISQSPFNEEEGSVKTAIQTDTEKVDNQKIATNEEAISQQDSHVKMEVEESKEVPEQVTQQTVAQKQQVYDEKEEPKIIEKSLFAEIFSAIF